jgi:hypothetical protein
MPKLKKVEIDLSGFSDAAEAPKADVQPPAVGRSLSSYQVPVPISSNLNPAQQQSIVSPPALPPAEQILLEEVRRRRAIRDDQIDDFVDRVKYNKPKNSPHSSLYRPVSEYDFEKEDEKRTIREAQKQRSQKWQKFAIGTAVLGLVATILRG